MRSAEQILDNMPIGSVIAVPAMHPLPRGWAIVAYAEKPGVVAKPDFTRILIEKRREVSA